MGGSSVPYVSLQYTSQTITKQHSFPSCKCSFVFNSTTHSLRPAWTRTTGRWSLPQAWVTLFSRKSRDIPQTLNVEQDTALTRCIVAWRTLQAPSTSLRTLKMSWRSHYSFTDASHLVAILVGSSSLGLCPLNIVLRQVAPSKLLPLAALLKTIIRLNRGRYMVIMEVNSCNVFWITATFLSTNTPIHWSTPHLPQCCHFLFQHIPLCYPKLTTSTDDGNNPH